jgi:RHS repeat-associated protein
MEWGSRQASGYEFANRPPTRTANATLSTVKRLRAIAVTAALTLGVSGIFASSVGAEPLRIESGAVKDVGYFGPSTSIHSVHNHLVHKLILGGPSQSSVGGAKSSHVGGDPTLTFSEYPVGTTITNQYESDGVIFSGDANDSNVPPYITTDSANPTSPVLSGGQGFGSDLRGSFVVPSTTTPATVSSMSFDLGYINTAGSTSVQIYGPADQLLGSVVANSTGIFLVTSNFSDASYFIISGVDPAGWAIDNLSFVSPTAITVAPKLAVGIGSGDSTKHGTTCTSGKNPVNCASGDFWHTFNDAVVPGYGPSLDLARTYNSLNAASEGIFGFGWSSSYDMHLVVNGDGSVTITEKDGSQVTAEPNGSGGFVMPTWADSTLTTSGGNYSYVYQSATSYSFNSTGQLTSITDPNGDATTLSYTSSKLHTVTDPSGRSLTFAYGSNGLVSSVTDPMSRETQYGYDSSGDLSSVTDPLGRVISFTYNSSHQLLTMTFPNGQSGGPDAGTNIVNTYNSSGQVLTQTDQLGRETTYAYTGDNFSSSGGTTTITSPNGNVEVESYVDGQLQTVTKGSSIWTYGFDQATLGETSVSDPNGNVTTSVFDSSGNRVAETNALGNTTTYSYNAFNEQICSAAPEATSPCSALSPPSAITAGTATITAPSSSPPPFVTYDEYDTDGNLIYQTAGAYAPGATTASYARTSYDLYNGQSVTIGSTNDSCATSAPSTSLPCATVDPNGVVTQLTFDSHGDLTFLSTPDGNAGGEVAKTTNTYDADGELLTTVTPDGNLSGANAANYTTTRTYDADGVLTNVTVGASGGTVVPRTTTYSYDPDGNLIDTAQSTSPELIGTNSGHNSSNTLSLTLPQGTLPGDQVVLATTTSPTSGGSSSFRQLTANDIYTIAGNSLSGTSNDAGQATEPQMNSPEATVTDSSGDVFIADSFDNEVVEVAATNHTQWGISMTAGDMYRLIGSSSGTAGLSGNGGAGTSALLNTPTGLALDSSGDLYVADQSNNRVQELAAATGSQWGISMSANDVYTVAGSSSGAAGHSGDGGVATSALLDQPAGVALDGSGNLFVADLSNSRIQEVAASTGTQRGQSMTAHDIYTIAGSSSGNSGHSGDGGAATSALLDAPQGIALDGSGNLFVADVGNNRVQEVAISTGTQRGQSMTANDIYTVAGSSSGSSGHSGNGGAATSALLDQPTGVAVDGSGNLFVADSANNRVQEVAISTGAQRGQSMTANDVYTVAGSSSGSSGYSGDGGSASSALLAFPTSVAVDSAGGLIIADLENNVVREVAGTTASQFSLTANDVFTVAGNYSTGTSGSGGQATDAQMTSPKGIVADSSGNLYIADSGANRVQELAATTHTQWGISMTAGNLYTILGSSAGTAGSSGDGGAGTSALLHSPSGVALDANGDLFVADGTNNRVQELAATNHTQWGISMTANDVYTVAGSSSGTSGHSGNGGAATSALLDSPADVALDGSGNLYIADAINNRVQEVAVATGSQRAQAMTANDVYTVAGSSSGTSGHSGNGGAATSALFDEPTGVAVDSSGDLFIADQNNNRVQEVAGTTGTKWGQSMTANDMYTVAGSSSGSSGHSGNGGAATSALQNQPTDVVLDTSGDLYVSDTGNSRLQEIAVATGTQWGQSMTANDVYTIAGSSSANSGYAGDGGVGTSALFGSLSGLALDSSGDVFIDDTDNSVVRELSNSSSSGGSETLTTPSGYTLQATSTTGSTTTYIYTHTVVSGDTGVTLNYSSSALKSAVLAVYRGVNATTPVDASSTGMTASGTSLTLPALTTTKAGDQLVGLAGAGQEGSSTTWTAPSGMTVRASDNGASGISLALFDATGPVAAGSTGSKTATASASGQLAGAFVALEPASVTTSTSFDAAKELVTATNADGQDTLTCYDGEGNVVETVPAVGVAANGLTAASCAKSTLYPSGYLNGSGVEYAPASLASDATLYTYNALADQLSVTTPAPAGQSSAQTTTKTYDLGGRLTSVSSPPASDVGGAADEVTTFSYNSANELVSTTSGSGTSAASITSACYDPDGDMTASVPGNGNTSGVAVCSSSSPWQTSSANQTGYKYDSLGELVSETRPATTWATSGQTTTNTYDADGNVLTSTSPTSVTTTNTYTPLDQLATVSYSGSSAHSVSDGYDANGNRVTMTDASGTSSFTYDPFGELVSTTNGAGKTIGYGYDSLGDEVSVTYPLGSGATWATSQNVTYGYDQARHLTSVTDFNGNTTVIVNNSDGLPTSMTLGGSGDTVSTTYDATDAPSAITLAQGSTTLLGFSYSRSPSGAIASETDTPSSSFSPADYAYDPLSRVTQMAPGTSSALNYSYDASSNLTTLPTAATTVYDNSGELTSSTKSSTTTTYTYNAAGERTTASGSPSTAASISWNGAGELTSYSNALANTSSATYDGNGLRTSATTTPTGGSASTQNFVWNLTSSVPGLLMDSTNAYIYGPNGAPIEQVNLSTGTIQYLVDDALGSVRGVLSSSGSLTASTSYDAWGNPETTGGLSSYTPFGFAGGYTDLTGNVYLINRYYDSSTGQFLSVDPLVGATGQAYAYADASPVNRTDPSGLDTVGICAVAGGQFGLLNAGAGACLTRTIDSSGEDDIGLTGTIAGGGGTGAGLSAGVYYQVSNATTLQQLKGLFFYETVGADVLGGTSVTVFWNLDRSVVGIEVGVSWGAGAYLAGGVSQTWVDQFNGIISANIARGIWDALNPGIALESLLAKAMSLLPSSGSQCN